MKNTNFNTFVISNQNFYNALPEDVRLKIENLDEYYNDLPCYKYSTQYYFGILFCIGYYNGYEYYYEVKNVIDKHNIDLSKGELVYINRVPMNNKDFKYVIK